jgi:hypothetical protein
MADKSIHRLFHITFSLHLHKDSQLPETANEWAERINMIGSTLESVTELRYPLAKDIIERRDEHDTYRYG